MVIRSTIAGVAGILMVLAAGSNTASAQGACPAGCDGATNWTGFWLGGGLGVNADMIGHDYRNTAALGHVELEGTYLGSGNDDTRGAAGLFGTVGLGYDWQVRERFVLGAFTDFDFGNAKHTEEDSWTYNVVDPVTLVSTEYTGKAGWEIERNSTWTIGTRIGLLTSNTSMVYGLIGYSRTSLDVKVYKADPGNTGDDHSTSRSMDFSGLVLGAGLEHDLGSGFSLKGEYRYTNYGQENWGSHTTPSNFETETDHFDLDSHSFRLTVAYKFGRAADVVQEVSYKDIAPAPSYTQPYK